MSEEPTGVFVQLPLSAEQEVVCKHCARHDRYNNLIRAIGTPVMGGELNPSRECFEKFYAAMCAKATGHNTTPEYVSGLREGDNYGGRAFLNNIWEAWPDYVQYAQAALVERYHAGWVAGKRDAHLSYTRQIAALEAEVVRLREENERLHRIAHSGKGSVTQVIHSPTRFMKPALAGGAA